MEDDILDRFLKVKKFADNQAPSYESDGLPSIISIEDIETASEVSTTNKRKLFADLEQLSNDAPDLESVSEDEQVRSSKSDLKRARELYEELRQMSVETGGSIDNIMEAINTEGINTSNESISSIIPFEKKQELTRFEMTLKQMIEEAKHMADGSVCSEEEELYSRKSSIHSIAESIVSVIEMHKESPSRLFPPERPPRRSTSPMKPLRKVNDVQDLRNIEEDRFLSKAELRESMNNMQALDSRKVEQDPGPLRIQVHRNFEDPGSMRVQPQQQQRTFEGQLQNSFEQQQQRNLDQESGSINGQAVRRSSVQKPVQPLIGAERYEEIIEARNRSRASSVVSSKAGRSVQGSMTNLFQPNITMAMREDTRFLSKSDLRDSMNLNGVTAASRAPDSKPTSRQDLRGSMTSLQKPEPKNMRGSMTSLNKRELKSSSRQDLAKKFEPVPIQPSIDPIRPENLAELNKNKKKSTSYPDWCLITLTYSLVFISILLVSNITPNGKLYIHFTAFWSMILYFVTDDVDNKSHRSTDVLDTVMESFVKVKK